MTSDPFGILKQRLAAMQMGGNQPPVMQGGGLNPAAIPNAAPVRQEMPQVNAPANSPNPNDDLKASIQSTPQMHDFHASIGRRVLAGIAGLGANINEGSKVGSQVQDAIKNKDYNQAVLEHNQKTAQLAQLADIYNQNQANSNKADLSKAQIYRDESQGNLANEQSRNILTPEERERLAGLKVKAPHYTTHVEPSTGKIITTNDSTGETNVKDFAPPAVEPPDKFYAHENFAHKLRAEEADREFDRRKAYEAAHPKEKADPIGVVDKKQKMAASRVTAKHPELEDFFDKNGNVIEDTGFLGRNKGKVELAKSEHAKELAKLGANSSPLNSPSSSSVGKATVIGGWDLKKRKQ